MCVGQAQKRTGQNNVLAVGKVITTAENYYYRKTGRRGIERAVNRSRVSLEDNKKNTEKHLYKGPEEKNRRLYIVNCSQRWV